MNESLAREKQTSVLVVLAGVIPLFLACGSPTITTESPEGNTSAAISSTVPFATGQANAEGILVSAPWSGSFTAYGGSYVQDSTGYHMLFCASGKTYDTNHFFDEVQDPEWNHIGQAANFGDRILYAHSTDGIHYTASATPAVQSPPGDIGSCQSSVVYYDAHDGFGPAYYLYYESGLRSNPSNGQTLNMIAIYVARSQTISGPYASWTGSSWQVVTTADPNSPRPYPVIQPFALKDPNQASLLSRMAYWYCDTPAGSSTSSCGPWSSNLAPSCAPNGSTTYDPSQYDPNCGLLQNPTYGAGMPVATVAHGQIHLWYFDSSLYVGDSGPSSTVSGKESISLANYPISFHATAVDPTHPTTSSSAVVHDAGGALYAAAGSGADFRWDPGSQNFVMFVEADSRSDSSANTDSQVAIRYSTDGVAWSQPYTLVPTPVLAKQNTLVTSAGTYLGTVKALRDDQGGLIFTKNKQIRLAVSLPWRSDQGGGHWGEVYGFSVAAPTTQMPVAKGLGALTLTAGQVFAVNGMSFVLQGDGNLVLYSPNAANGATPLFATNTSQSCGTGNTCVAAFQGDGNLVLYRNNVAYWASNTAGTGVTLEFHPVYPYLKILDAGGAVKWQGN